MQRSLRMRSTLKMGLSADETLFLLAAAAGKPFEYSWRLYQSWCWDGPIKSINTVDLQLVCYVACIPLADY